MNRILLFEKSRTANHSSSLFTKCSGLIMFLFLVSGGVYGQVDIFSENMGNGSGTKSISENIFQNSNLIFSGDADIRSTSPSDNYIGHSADRNVFITNSINRYFVISGINTTSYSSIYLTFGISKTGTSTANYLSVEISADGISYTPLSYTIPPNAYQWNLTTASGIIPSTSNLRIRFRNPSADQQFRIDDVKLVGVETDCITSPIANEAEFTTNSFTGNWLPVADALSYEIDVYKLTGENIIETSSAYWDFETASPTSSPTGLIISNITRANNNGTNPDLISGSSSSSGYTGTSGNNNVAAAAKSGTLSTNASGSTYFQFNITPNSGDSILCSGISFGNRSTSTGPKAYALRSSLDNYASNIISGSIENNSVWSLKSATNLTVSGSQDQTITFRIYGYNGGSNANSNIANWRIDDLKVDLSVEISSVVKSYVVQNLNIGNVTSYELSDLIPGTTYYYVVRALNPECESNNSNEIEISLPTHIIWETANVWNNVNGPTIKDNTLIKGQLIVETNKNIQTKALTLEANATITIQKDGTVTTAAVLTNNNVDNVATTTVNEEASTFKIEDGGSLVQTSAFTGVNLGKIQMERITKPMYRYDYTYWSSPVETSFTLNNLSPNTLPNKYFKWNHSAPTPIWQTIQGGTEGMVAGKGYIVRAPQSFQVEAAAATPSLYNANFIGKPNNGTVTIGVTGSSDATVNKWNLIGNPYPSAIDADAFLSLNADTNNILGGTLYFWTHNTGIGITENPTYSYISADYASWNDVGGTATNPNNPTNTPNGKIAAGQSFFIKGIASGNVTFNNSMRIAGQNDQFFRSATTTEKHRVWLNMKGTTKGFSQTLVGYVTDATDGFDNRFDGETFGGNQVTFYTMLDTKALVIQGRALPFLDSDTVPLGYKSTITENISIGIDHFDGLFDNQNIYLEDTDLNIVHDLKDSDYTFATVPGTFNTRFILRYLPSETLDNPSFEQQLQSVIIRKNDAILRVNSPYDTINTIWVYDLMGRLVFEQKNCNTNTFETNQITQTNQTLIVKVKLKNGAVVTEKL